MQVCNYVNVERIHTGYAIPIIPVVRILTVTVVGENIIKMIIIMIICLHLGNTSVYGVINQPDENENGTVHIVLKIQYILFSS